MESKSKFVICSSFSILGAVISVLVLDAIFLAGTQRSYTDAIHKFISNPQQHLGATLSLCNCKNFTTPSIPEPQKECPNADSSPSFSPWYEEGRAWHYPARFPRCTMDVCFNYSRCDNTDELLIYSYNYPPQLKFFSNIHNTRWHTDNPEKACLFFLFTETDDPYHSPSPEHPSKKPYWNGGLNHVLVSFSDSWELAHMDQESIGKASLLRTGTHESVYRPGFDISMPLPPHHRFVDLQSIKPWNRKYFLTFRGLQYLGKETELGVFRSFDSFTGMHNGKDIVIAASCNHPNNNQKRKDNATIDAKCKEDEKVSAEYGDYKDLMNSTFCLAPAGRQPNSYRFSEILGGGGIPVVIADNYVKPYDTLIQWYKCILQFPTIEMKRIVPTLRKMSRYEMEKRQEYCLEVYRTYFATDESLMKGVVDSFKARFMGAVPGLMPEASLSYL